ncbi:hypothetical protein ACHAXT_012498 [Thalassiosira profunda]
MSYPPPVVDDTQPPAPPSPGADLDNELPNSPVAEPAGSPTSSPGDGDDITAVHERRTATHSKLRAYEAERRAAYESKLQSTSLYWHAFRTLMHDSLLETQKADLLLRGWAHASNAYGNSMASVGEWCIDEKGAPILDPKRKKRHLEAGEKHEKHGGASSVAGLSGSVAGLSVGGVSVGGVSVGGVSVGGDHHSTAFAVADFYREEKCGAMLNQLANSAGHVAGKYDEMAQYMSKEVLPELSLLLSETKQEVVFMEKLGDSIINELEAAEGEVCKAWDAYYQRALDWFGSSPDAAKAPASPNANAAVKGCSDVWVEEMRYRMAVAFLSSVWEKCSSELSKLFLSTKDTECNRRNQIKEIMIKATQRQERLWLGLPSTINPVLKELIEWPMERKEVEDDVQSSIRERAQSIQLEEVVHKKSDDATPTGPGLTGVTEGDGNFELSSPLVSDLLCKAKVLEKRGTGMMSSWKVSLAIITSDSFLHLFELPPTCRLHSGSAPEVAFQNLIPPVVVPSVEGLKGGVKYPSPKHWFDKLVPSESFALPNCVVTLVDEKKIPNAFEVVETVVTSGASKMLGNTTKRKMQFKAVTREEAKDFVDALKESK